MKNIAIVYDGVEYGGVEKYILKFLQYLDRSRYSPTVVIAGYNYRFCPPRFLEELREQNVAILTPSNASFSRAASFIADVWSLVRLFKSARFEIVHIQTSRLDGGRRATLAARLAGIPVVLRTEHVPPSANYQPHSSYIIKLCDWLTDLFIVDSDSSREEQIRLLKRDPRRIWRSYCGVEPEKFQPVSGLKTAKQRLGLDPAIPVVGCIARLSEQKGHTYLVEAAAQVIRRHGPVNFLLVGDGPLEEALRRQVAGAGLERYFHFAGFQAGYLPYMEAMDLAVMPSLYEGFSLTMLEFMAAGKPLVVTDHPSFKEALLDGESALIVPVKDPSGLAEAIGRLLQDPALAGRLGCRALEKVNNSFTIQRLVYDIMDCYDRQLCSKKAGKSNRVKVHA